MESTQKAVEIGLVLRAEAKIKVRQPLAKLILEDKAIFENIYLDLVKQELNVKEVVLGDKNAIDLEISEELKMEGIFRELIRQINQLRKEQHLNVNDRNVILNYETSSVILKNLIEKFGQQLKKDCSCAEIKFGVLAIGKELDINGEKIKINLIKI